MPYAHPPRRRPVLPVFLDRSGRRRRLVLVAGAFFGVLLMASAGMLVAGMSGASPTGVPGFPDAVRQVDEATPGPDAPPPTTTPDPGTSGQVPPSTLPTPGASAPTDSIANRRVPSHTPAHPPKPTKN
jgi:hypothetical protein